jgi:hypothetical protein
MTGAILMASGRVPIAVNTRMLFRSDMPRRTEAK